MYSDRPWRSCVLRGAAVQLCGLASTSPARRHRSPSPGWPTIGRGLFAPGRLTSSLAPCGVRMYASVAPSGGARPRTKIPPADEHTSALRALLATGTPSRTASKPICRFCSSEVVGSLGLSSDRSRRSCVLRSAAVQVCGLTSTPPARRHRSPSPGWPTTGRDRFAPGRLATGRAAC